MKFLIERELNNSNFLTKEDIINYEALDNRGKQKFVDQWVSNLKKFGSTGKNFIKDYINQKGFKLDDPLMEYIKQAEKSNDLEAESIYGPHLDIVDYLMSDNKLKPNQSWLYWTSLYDETVDDGVYKIKALTYVTNPDMQKNASKQLSFHDRDKEGNPIFAEQSSKFINSAENIKKALSTVKVSRDQVNKEQNKKLKEPENALNPEDPRLSDARQALASLGMKNKEINKTLSSIEISDSDSPEIIITKALRSTAQNKVR